MDRRKFLSLLPAGVVAGEALAAGGGQPQPSARPNFLFMIADDLTFRSIQSSNNAEVHTPNLDRLVASGCHFTHTFHQGSWSPAVCVPSRTMLTTGLSAFRAEKNADDVQTWGQTLGVAGYDTYLCGKWHLDPVVLGRSFKELGTVAPGMLESTPEGGAAYNRPSPGNTWQPDDETQRGHWLHTDLWKGETPDRIEHSDTIYTDQVVDYLKNQAHRTAPFFAYVGFNAPHDPRQSPREYLERYLQNNIEIPPNFLPQHPFDQGDAHIRDELLAPFPRTKEAVQLHRREYYSLITHLDAHIGKILDALQQSGRAKNTYVILTADHGLAVGEHGLMGKQNMYDCSTRMPLLISGPGIAPGRKVNDLVYQHSMFATTCELAGVAVPKTVEFPSLVPLLHGDAPPVHDAVFCYYRDFQRSVRTQQYKLIVYPKIGRVQLFDVAADPWEMHDLVDDPSHSEVKSTLLARLRSFQAELGDHLDLKLA